MSNLPDKHLNRRLLNAVLDEDYKECQFLLNSGADPNHLFSEHDGGISSFHIAVGVDNDLEFTRLFLNFNADVQLKCKKLGWTVLHVCAHWNKYRSLNLLILNKADPNIRCKNNKNVLQTAIENNSIECIQILRDCMRKNYLQVFSNPGQNVKLESELDLTSVSSMGLDDSINSFSFVRTSTFDEMKLADSLLTNTQKDQPPPVPPRKHKLNKTPHVYINIEENNDTNNNQVITNEKTPVKVSSSSLGRFQSPEKLPTFYYKLLQEESRSEQLQSTMRDQETQTNAKCVTIKQSEIQRASTTNHTNKSISPQDVVNYYSKQQPEKVDNNFPAFNIYSKFRSWVSKFNLSPLLGSSSSNTNEQDNTVNRLSRARCQQKQTRSFNQQKSLSPSFDSKRHNEIQSSKVFNVNQRASSLASKSTSHQNRSSPSEPKEVSFSHLNEFITDEIGSTFFRSVLGQTNSSNSSGNGKHSSTLTPIKADGKIFKTNLNEIKSVSESNDSLFKLRQSPPADNNLNSSIITFDNSALITSDEMNQTKKSTSTFKTAQYDLDEQNVSEHTLTEALENRDDLNDLVKSFEKLNTNTLTEQLKFIKSNLNESNRKLKENTKNENIKTPIILNNKYSNELYEQIENKLNTTDSSEMIMSNMFNCFLFNPNHVEWREGNIKSAFNYLLIDPRISQNLPLRAKYLNEKHIFRSFIASIFYIGKGTRARPYAHLQDALKLWKHTTNQATSPQTILPKKSKKIDRIISIWEDKYGIVSLHCFQNVIPSEAYTREAAMIDAIGIHNLTNIKKGNYYGEAKDWSAKHKNQLGTILLKRACAIFLGEGERQLNPLDIKV